LDLLLKIKDVDASVCRGGPVFDIYSNSSEEYSSRSTTPSSRLQKGLGDVGVTTCRAAPPLKTTRNPMATPNHFWAAFWLVGWGFHLVFSPLRHEID
jgi:hypothetical protein